MFTNYSSQCTNGYIYIHIDYWQVVLPFLSFYLDGGCWNLVIWDFLWHDQSSVISVCCCRQLNTCCMSMRAHLFRREWERERDNSLQISSLPLSLYPSYTFVCSINGTVKTTESSWKNDNRIVWWLEDRKTEGNEKEREKSLFRIERELIVHRSCRNELLMQQRERETTNNGYR